MTKQNYFHTPIQVKFFDYDEGKWLAGIAYKDEIICGCCGGIFEIMDIRENAPEGINAIVPYETWIDLTYEITGEDEDFLDNAD